MWQYSSKGKVDGIETNVDLDTSYMKDIVGTKNNVDNDTGNADDNVDSNAGNNADSNAENQQ
jgi:GH25 family lysozyme M1 (1,4-beta-N-acetylmuramidase)